MNLTNIAPSQTLEEFESRLAQFVDPVALPSVAYGISRGSSDLVSGGFGASDKESGLAASPAIPYSLASISKPLTATGVVLLASRGLIDLDAPIDSYLGGLALVPRMGSGVTVRQVANHTAGLPLHCQFFYADEPFPRPPFAETVRRYAKTFSKPGSKYRYSNLGYGLLDHLIEVVSGRPFAEFMREEVFLPLGMSTASIDAPFDRPYAKSYGEDGVAYPRYTFDHPGGSAAFASVADLLAFGRFQLGLGPALFSAEWRKEMRRPTARTGRLLKDGGYGLGFSVIPNRFGLGIFGHTGYMGGVSTIMRMVPSLDLAVVILTNGQTGLTGAAADEALAAVHAGFRRGLATSRRRTRTVPAKPIPASALRSWDGYIEVLDARLPLRLNLFGEPTAVLDGHSASVEDLAFANGQITGSFEGLLPSEEVSRYPYRLQLQLTVSRSRMCGAVVAVTHRESYGGAPCKRLGNTLSFWTDLKAT